MSPTSELRYVKNDRAPQMPPKLQQKWVTHHIPSGQTDAPFEWRDIETVEETK